MTGPDPDLTPAGPTYQGRLLPRPGDEVVDQGLRFDLGTLLNRRRMLRALGLGAGAAALAACGTGRAATDTAGSTAGTSGAGGSGSAAAGSTTTSATATSAAGSTATDLVEIPDETAGPYPGDGSNGPDVLTESSIIRSDLRSSFGTGSATAAGVPFTFTLTILDLAQGGAPFVGVAVYAWHCNRDGEYSLYGNGIENENYLRGVQLTDETGAVTFTSIFPACYSGRWPHVHFEVYPDRASLSDAGNAVATSQMALPQHICEQVYGTEGYQQSVSNLAGLSLDTDNVFGDDDGAHQLATVAGNLTEGFRAALVAPIDTTTQPSTGSGPGLPPGQDG